MAVLNEAVAILVLRPGRRIEGISAVPLPLDGHDRPDRESFRSLIDRTYSERARALAEGRSPPMLGALAAVT